MPEVTPAASHLVVFGASGDLARRKLWPALYRLAAAGRLPEPFIIVGYARRAGDDALFREGVAEAVRAADPAALRDPNLGERFAGALRYVSGGYDDPEGYARLGALLQETGQPGGGGTVYYLAVPPEVYATIVRRLDASGLTRRGDASRVVVEKPFGQDLDSARALNQVLHRCLDEGQIYRIDHYLGKETVQNLLVFRFGNTVFEPVWNRRYVDHVQITAAETVGVETRGGYYEHAGAVRDMLQNHLLQLLCLTAMEPPVAMWADPVRDEKTKVLRSVRPVAEVDQAAVRGQYGPGIVEGRPVAGYREEPAVASDSMTETYAALRLFVDNWRWQGVPFYLRAGKRLARRVTEIAIQFREPPLLFFRGCDLTKVQPNTLVLRIQPDEGIALTFEVKEPGPEVCVSPCSLEFGYETAFGQRPPDAYEVLLLDCLRGDPTHFIRHDWVELAWEIVEPVLRRWGAARDQPPQAYAAGSWGPAGADRLLAQDGRAWRRP